uniref:Uncharacterized protein n=2 Tax=Vibrio TaxID=662 RepID=A0A0H3ZUE9_9VIBR|nr:hypothetical protein [Vibrio splendidus]AKN40023.1 hypothetical protein [Vibrio tasmaniensis]
MVSQHVFATLKAQRWAKNYQALDPKERLAVLAAMMEVE